MRMLLSRVLVRILAGVTLAVAFALPALAQSFDTTARAAWVYDMTTGSVLMEKNAHEPMPPASMSKLMTLYMLFEALEQGRVTLDTTFPVSTRARQMGGSTMFLNELDRPTVDELIKGIIVLSGNDACVVVAEGLAGTEEAFAREMTARAHELGLTDTNLVNASGWPAPGHVMSASDLGKLAQHLVEDFPEHYRNFALDSFDFDGRAPANTRNRNPILGLGIGADGLKTGHTQEAGYGLVGSAVQNGRRVIFVVNGLPSERARAEESERIVNWAFRQFTMKTVIPKGETVAWAPVWLGQSRRVALTAPEGVNVLIPAGAASGVTAEAVFDGPIEAPIEAGKRYGELVVSVPGSVESRLPLVAATEVPRAGFVGRLQNAALRLGQRAVAAVGG